MRLGTLAVSILPISLWTLVAARLQHHSLVPEDPYAFPKYRVTFLHGLPVPNDTAQKWLQSGLHGGELEFLEQPWEEDHRWRTPSMKSIDDGTDHEADNTETNVSNYKLELMKMGPRTSYLCLIPPPPVETAPIAAENPSTDITPVHTWSLLQPLSGTCLYHRQAWFTYSYCHNSHVRQFHELAKPQAHHPGEYRPEEDTAWEAYTLGRAPPTLEPGADLTVAQEAALAANVELARNAGSRYLVQRWGDGTYCEKIGRKREIEIQFHCSMTMTDTILFVKETQTCHYILHIATPRLCGEPGFRSRHDAHEQTNIRCREIVSSETYASADRSLPAADGPFRMPKRAPKPVIAPPPEEDKDKQEKALLTQAQHETLRKAIETLMANGELKAGEVIIQPFGEGDEEFVVEFIDYLNGEEDEEGTVHTQAPSLDEILRAAGLLDSKGPKKQPDSRDQDREDDEDKKIAKEPHTRDEL